MLKLECHWPVATKTASPDGSRVGMPFGDRRLPGAPARMQTLQSRQVLYKPVGLGSINKTFDLAFVGTVLTAAREKTCAPYAQDCLENQSSFEICCTDKNPAPGKLNSELAAY